MHAHRCFLSGWRVYFPRPVRQLLAIRRSRFVGQAGPGNICRSVRLSWQVATYPLLSSLVNALSHSSRPCPARFPSRSLVLVAPDRSEFLSQYGTKSHATTARQARVGIATVEGEKWRGTALREAAYTLFVIIRDTNSTCHRQILVQTLTLKLHCIKRKRRDRFA